MMKRTVVARAGADELAQMAQAQPTIQQQGASNMHTLAQTAQPQLLGAATMLQVSGGVGGFGRAPAVINYMKQPLQYANKPQPLPLTPRHKPLGSQSPGPPPTLPPAPTPPAQPATQFQRLKVEDALSYLDQVKYKFNTQPQVYNDFLDIMKEFKSQTIDTPGVITRVSNLFKGHPELIVGFNTFLPPGYKIEVQSNGQSYVIQVSVSMPSPSALGGGVLLGVHHAPQPQLVHLLPVPQPEPIPTMTMPRSVSTAIVHNLSVEQPSNTLHHISQAHQQLEAAIHHQQQPGGVASGGSQHPQTPPGQPVEFNHAIEYVNKIKSRFSRQPDKYKRFLEILHAYQRGHRDLKQPQAKQQTEQEVYSQVAKLFENQDDLLAEFGQFLPDAKAPGAAKPPAPLPAPHSPPPPANIREEPERYNVAPVSPSPPQLQTHAQIPKHPGPAPAAAPAQPPPHPHLKRSPSFSSTTGTMASGAPPPKKPRPSGLTGAHVRDVSYAEAAKCGSMHEYNYFDRVRKALRSQHVYDNFLRCLLLYTNEIISASELVSVTAPFLCRHGELRRWLQDFVRAEPPAEAAPYNNYNPTSGSLLSYDRERLDSKQRLEPIGALAAQLRHDRPQGDAAMDIDLSTCKRLGTSYCALPRGSAEAASRRCSGRTALCKEVLNDTWVSFPSWSEESTFVTSRKTQYEEYIYRCEDERFELDVVIETNAATIRVLEGVQKKLSRMSAEDAAKYRLDDCLGGHSPTIHQRALRRIYGDKVAVDIIAGLKKNPVVAVPVVLRRLKAKEEEWREAQKGFNKQWREQNEKYYLKSLDHQGINFKQNDLKALRSKSLFNEVESAFAARKPGPHVCVDYGMSSRQEAIKIVRDAAELLIHHARRQTAIQKAEKRRIKQLLRQFLPELLSHPPQPLSDDERDDEDKEEAASPDSASPDDADEKISSGVKIEKESSESDNNSDKSTKHNKNNKENTPKNNNNTESKDSTITSNAVKRSSSNEEAKSDIKSEPSEVEDDYRDHPPNEARFVCTASWYLFLRLHGALCQRLAGARHAAAAAPAPSASATANALRLKPNNLPADVTSPSEYYNALLELVKNVLDGNMEPSAFEDAAREMFGIKAYPAYTLDKIVSYAVRQLQHCVSEVWSVRAAELFARGRRGGYVRRAVAALTHHHAAFLVRAYSGDECKMTFELLEGAGDGRTSPTLNNDSSRLSPTSQSRVPTNGSAAAAAWALYSERYMSPRAPSPPPGANKPVFLARNARRGGGGGGANLAPGGGAAHSHHARHKRKPTVADLHDCCLSNRLRLLAARPHHLYRRGCLKAARDSQERLQARRRRRFHAWLRRRSTDT
ncbi:paired amphipathic helix protein Sin3a isoform X5 [Plutella xylostella]|uniref:paired amphipathic helix protein Sin3a isoform X5 n=1 Tax=Plutella xylostella TaxID=51655 RepID=UPI0020331A6D|nr:paired amphipathic helix protein Sin3a isoform X5 [Plutella xylostella]